MVSRMRTINHCHFTNIKPATAEEQLFLPHIQKIRIRAGYGSRPWKANSNPCHTFTGELRETQCLLSTSSVPGIS